jgi:integrase/recombinase XerD
MRHLVIYNKEYRQQLSEFRSHLERIGYHPNTQKSMHSSLQEFFYWLERQGIHQIEAITAKQIRKHYEYLNERPNQTRPGNLSESMVHGHLWSIKTFFNYQQSIGKITINPFSILTFPKVEHKQREVLSIEEVKELYAACETMRDQAMLGLFYGCGMRRAEAMQLNISDIHFKSGLLYVRSGKGKKRRVIPLTEQVITDLKNYYLYERSFYSNHNHIGEQAFILHQQGGRMRDYWKRLKYLIKKAGLPKQISLHHLRHSIATHLLESGLSIEQVRDFLGHAHLESTQIYTRISRKYLAEQTC